MMADYTLRSFPVRLEDGKVPAEVAAWDHAVSAGFYGAAPDETALRRLTALEQLDNRVLTGAYQTDAPLLAGAWGPEYPVATFASYNKDLNVGGLALLAVHQITAVTVRPTHRRRGLLRRMMEADLAQAKKDGLPLAALTATEATIYGRFGFGVATHTRSIEVDTRGGLEFWNPAAASHGTVEIGDLAAMKDLHNEVFGKAHVATYGSIARHEMNRLKASGQGSYESMEPNKKVRAAYHYNANGEVDGYVVYEPKEEPAPATVKVVDFIAANQDAYLALWSFLGSLDLMERVSWEMAPEVDPLEWAVSAKRRYQVKGSEDHLWLRILDVAAALQARTYRGAGSLVLSVSDPLGHAAGTYRVDVSGGVATVAITEAPADLALGISELSSLYLGGVSAQTFLSAGRLSENTPGAVASFDEIFSPAVVPYCGTSF